MHALKFLVVLIISVLVVEAVLVDRNLAPYASNGIAFVPYLLPQYHLIPGIYGATGYYHGDIGGELKDHDVFTFLREMMACKEVMDGLRGHTPQDQLCRGVSCLIHASYIIMNDLESNVQEVFKKYRNVMIVYQSNAYICTSTEDVFNWNGRKLFIAEAKGNQIPQTKFAELPRGSLSMPGKFILEKDKPQFQNLLAEVNKRIEDFHINGGTTKLERMLDVSRARNALTHLEESRRIANDHINGELIEAKRKLEEASARVVQPLHETQMISTSQRHGEPSRLGAAASMVQPVPETQMASVHHTHEEPSQLEKMHTEIRARNVQEEREAGSANDHTNEESNQLKRKGKEKDDTAQPESKRVKRT